MISGDTTMNFLKRCFFFAITMMIPFLFACSAKKMYQLDLLPAPEAYSSGLVNPFTDNNQIKALPYGGILFATDREPATEDDTDLFFSEKSGLVLRLGVGSIKLGDKNLTWEEAKKISMLKNRKGDYPLHLESITEIGMLDRTFSVFMDPALAARKSHEPAEKYAQMINDKLAVSKKKDIYIYVHGYNTNFQDPILVASELWHYLGYDGVFIAYAWPATERGMAYLGDTEKARWTSRNLRLFIEYLSEETNAENIHIVAYSMGTRVSTWAVEDLALIYLKESPESVRKRLRVGNVLLFGSDLSVYAFTNYLQDGILNVAKSISLYSSDEDTVLGASQWLFDHTRLGRITEQTDFPPQAKAYLEKHPDLRLIDASHARDVGEGKGHQYFRQSPWVSSDLLMTLMYDLPPENRGLVRSSKAPVWEFPDDYIQQLRSALKKANPIFRTDGQQNAN